MRNTVPLISFTFDDFPLSALEVGGRILREHGVAGTYYVSLGLLDREESVGRICSSTHLKEVLAQGHELGCHTFSHCDAWDTEPHLFEVEILKNQRVLQDILPGTQFKTISYPISTTPRPVTKKQTGSHFSCCRTGGQTNNVGTIDLNYVRSFFIEQSREEPSVIWDLIDRNRVEKGWLIFSTHDVTDLPSRYGCTPRFFRDVVSRAVGSNTQILPVLTALKQVLGPARNGQALPDDLFRQGAL
ncbi:MAG TPA: polysaccharide deacetylase family protein [Nitrospira sp.]|nr:polysaccharide deacetylase family protein [Nitrospira sp.]